MSDHPHFGPPQHGGYGPPPGHPGYGPPGPGGPGWHQPPHPPPYAPLPPEQVPSPAGAVTALVVSVLLVPLCLGNITPLVGTVMAGMALAERGHDPRRHDRLKRYAWISNGIHGALVALAVIAVVVAVAADA